MRAISADPASISVVRGETYESMVLPNMKLCGFYGSKVLTTCENVVHVIDPIGGLRYADFAVGDSIPDKV